MAQHGGGGPTTGTQKKPRGCKHHVNPDELHLHLVWFDCSSPSPSTPLFIHPGALRPRRGGVDSYVMWPTGLAEEGVRSAIHRGNREVAVCLEEVKILALFGHLAALQRAWTSTVKQWHIHVVTKRGKGRRGVGRRAGGERGVTSKESRRKRNRERKRERERRMERNYQTWFITTQPLICFRRPGRCPETEEVTKTRVKHMPKY